ncbi:ribosomal RNA small subunit methyltransferase A [Candidatus Nomurabacteria bacterium RIFOXYC2_FULL_36_8]|nr:MAG: Ribosomal RNA small subunit methyltransferase A [Candidatus Nomurabacteria bacterium GW2011_GWE2_36_115]KKP93530.1 MAG: Ribosomal RNA small subunit methyltransferase A [Candidatus Nomurabacteria bacterium GW2011_GWF2_36_126]KKP97080.1 MAG: Ribosomal RNA small subunit methyltransferase A [Candidatus Nomurabacteria bacterium GW2011_GWD2_36_14]KKP98918.1 MAG: Ribosomal RNA small subunit methyltransferase A [Candidatus Nomurabacteria bacterium GW2011_GWF2_36_19]KKQ05959.1 MAG: Ribosomal RNA
MIHKAKKSLGLNKFSVENLSPDFSSHRAKKNLGQNFLKSKEALFKMCEAGGVSDKDVIVEIGPGKGALTEKLLEKAYKVIAIEKDRDLIDILKDKFANEIKNGPNLSNKTNGQCKLTLLNEDILGFDPAKHGLKEGGYKIIANIPYNITGSIIRRFLSEVNKPITMTLLVQKEVAERIVARDGKESILSLSVKAYGMPSYIMKVHKRFFSPSPKVDSAIVSINDISGKLFKDKSTEESFFTLIKAGFAHKRKVLRKNLEDINIKEVEPSSSAGKLPKIDEIFKKLGINPKARAEDVPFSKWVEMNDYFRELI